MSATTLLEVASALNIDLTDFKEKLKAAGKRTRNKEEKELVTDPVTKLNIEEYLFLLFHHILKQKGTVSHPVFVKEKDGTVLEYLGPPVGFADSRNHRIQAVVGPTFSELKSNLSRGFGAEEKDEDLNVSQWEEDLKDEITKEFIDEGFSKYKSGYRCDYCGLTLCFEDVSLLPRDVYIRMGGYHHYKSINCPIAIQTTDDMKELKPSVIRALDKYVIEGTGVIGKKERELAYKLLLEKKIKAQIRAEKAKNAYQRAQHSSDEEDDSDSRERSRRNLKKDEKKDLKEKDFSVPGDWKELFDF